MELALFRTWSVDSWLLKRDISAFDNLRELLIIPVPFLPVWFDFDFSLFFYKDWIAFLRIADSFKWRHVACLWQIAIYIFYIKCKLRYNRSICGTPQKTFTWLYLDFVARKCAERQLRNETIALKSCLPQMTIDFLCDCLLAQSTIANRPSVQLSCYFWIKE